MKLSPPMAPVPLITMIGISAHPAGQLSINKYTGYRWARNGATQLGRIVLNCS